MYDNMSKITIQDRKDRILENIITPRRKASQVKALLYRKKLKGEYMCDNPKTNISFTHIRNTMDTLEIA